MIRGIEGDLGELLGKGFEVKVVSMSGGKMWDVMRHLGKWTKEKMDWCGGARGNKPHTEGDGDFRCGRVWKGGRKNDRGSRQAMWEGSRDVVGADTEGGPRETGLRSIKQGNEELVRVMKRKGCGYISHWREFMEGNK